MTINKPLTIEQAAALKLLAEREEFGAFVGVDTAPNKIHVVTARSLFGKGFAREEVKPGLALDGTMTRSNHHLAVITEEGRRALDEHGRKHRAEPVVRLSKTQLDSLRRVAEKGSEGLRVKIKARALIHPLVAKTLKHHGFVTEEVKKGALVIRGVVHSGNQWHAVITEAGLEFLKQKDAGLAR
jgi:hypothetical protein